SKQRQDLYLSNAVDQHLPPIDPKDGAGRAENPVDYNTEERIQAIKKFVQLKRKQRNKSDLKLKRLILSQEAERFDDYDQLRQVLEQRFSNTFRDVVPDYTDHDNDDPSSLE